MNNRAPWKNVTSGFRFQFPGGNGWWVMGDPALSLELWSSRSLSYTLADYSCWRFSSLYSLDNFLVLFKQTFHRLITGQLVLIYIATRREASHEYVDKIWYIYIRSCCASLLCQKSAVRILTPRPTFHTIPHWNPKIRNLPPGWKRKELYPLSATLIHRRRAKKRRANYTQYGQYIYQHNFIKLAQYPLYHSFSWWSWWFDRTQTVKCKACIENWHKYYFFILKY